MGKLDRVACSSDAFFPFLDNVHCAWKSGVRYFAALSGSVMDEECVKVADEPGIVFEHTSLRLFHHLLNDKLGTGKKKRSGNKEMYLS